MLNASRNSWLNVKVKGEHSGSSGVSSLDTFKEEACRDEAYESWTSALASSTPNSSKTGFNGTAKRSSTNPKLSNVDSAMAMAAAGDKFASAVYSRKIFIGGLPIDINAEGILASFSQYGLVQVGWPHKTDTPFACPPNGYCFLQFQEEASVHRLVNACVLDSTGYFTAVSSPTFAHKLVQVRPWLLNDRETILDPDHLDARKAVFIGGVPRPLKSSQLADIMSRLYGAVSYAAIDVDPELGYPKGSARVVFCSRNSAVSAIGARFVQIEHEEISKRVEVKPFILQDQMCDVCKGERCDNKVVPYYCANIRCLMYLCNECWAKVHVLPGRELHKPLLQRCNFQLHEKHRMYRLPKKQPSNQLQSWR